MLSGSFILMEMRILSVEATRLDIYFIKIILESVQKIRSGVKRLEARRPVGKLASW